MRGRKKDPEFLSNFISSCVSIGKSSSEEIVNQAKEEVNLIDEKIKEVEILKIRRSKLLDIISTFDVLEKDYKQEKEILSFFNISNINVCKFICDNIKKSVIKIEDLYNHGYDNHDILFCIKQLLEHKIISKSGNLLLRGENFQEYLKFVLKDTEWK